MSLDSATWCILTDTNTYSFILTRAFVCVMCTVSSVFLQLNSVYLSNIINTKCLLFNPSNY